MAPRSDFHALLKQIVGPGVKVYFQPPNGSQMVYPAVVYAKDDINNIRADNGLYLATWAYSVTIIDKDPDSEIPDKINELPMTSMTRAFVTEDLYHTSFRVYF